MRWSSSIRRGLEFSILANTEPAICWTITLCCWKEPSSSSRSWLTKLMSLFHGLRVPDAPWRMSEVRVCALARFRVDPASSFSRSISTSSGLCQNFLSASEEAILQGSFLGISQNTARLFFESSFLSGSRLQSTVQLLFSRAGQLCLCQQSSTSPWLILAAQNSPPFHIESKLRTPFLHIGLSPVWWRIWWWIWWQIWWSPNLAMNLVTYSSPYLVIHQIWWWFWWHFRHHIWWVTKLGDDFGDKFGDKFVDSQNLVMFLVMNTVTNLVTNLVTKKVIKKGHQICKQN